jgi:hypothetical protein
MIGIRRLAAVDLAYLGPKFILTEFTFGVLGPAALGIWTLWRSESIGGTLVGAYLVSLGINYVPLLLYAIDIARQGTAQAEIADEAGDRRALFRKYRRQSLLLLVPLAVPVIALAQEWRTRTQH